MSLSSMPKWCGKWVLEHIKINSFSAVAMLQGFDKMWGARIVLCRRRNLHIEWNWKRQVGRQVYPRFGMWVGGLGVVLGKRVGGGILGLVGSVGSPWWCLVVWFFFTWRCLMPEGSRLPSVMGVFFSWFQFIWRWLCWPFVSKKEQKRKKKRKYKVFQYKDVTNVSNMQQLPREGVKDPKIAS